MNVADAIKLNAALAVRRVTPESCEAVIYKEHYHVVQGTTLTLCTLVLKNGFTVTGQSACVSADFFNDDIGKRVARENALDKVAELECYALRNTILRGE